MMATTAREDGFTLVELLVSLVITAAAAGLLSATLVAGRTARDHGEASAAAVDSVAAAQANLRHAIESVIEEGRPSGSVAAETTLGSPHAFTFLAPPPASRPPSGLLRYTLGLTVAGTLGYTIGDRTDGMVRSTTPLISGVRTLDIAYFGTAPDDPISRWRSRWDGQANAPELVRVRISFPPQDARRWPDLIVAPIATVNAACTVDPNSGKCG